MGKVETPSSLKIVKMVFQRKPGAEPKNGIRSCRVIALTAVMSRWCASCIVRLEKEKEPQSWKKLHVGGIDGISWQQLRAMTTQLLQKHWWWQEDRRPMMGDGSVIRPTKYSASMDIKTAF